MNWKIFLFAVLIIIAACESSDPIPPLSGPNPTNLDFAGVQLTDANGQAIGCLGDDCTDDWTNRALTARELSFLAFADNTPDGDIELGEAEIFPIFPNPLGNNDNMGIAFETTGKLKFKMAIVDELGETLVTQALETQNGFNNLQISSEALENLDRKIIYRLYYAFFDATNAPVNTGYGDFGICQEDFNPTPQDCFE